MNTNKPDNVLPGEEEELASEARAHIEIDELTGLPVLVSPPGTPLLTSERVRELLEDFP
jgi:hypothetical protein